MVAPARWRGQLGLRRRLKLVRQHDPGAVLLCRAVQAQRAHAGGGRYARNLAPVRATLNASPGACVAQHGRIAERYVVCEVWRDGAY